MENKNKLNYQELGLRCGIEIHQRLKTHKLFCKCPSILRDDTPDINIKRKLFAVAGETGQIDIAALHEMDKGETFHYEGYHDTTCLVEFDEEPPQPMNQEALNTVLQVSKMLNGDIVDEIQVMRKTVVNGSNTSGFQRTSLVAIDGYLNSSKNKITIPTISIEEESAKDIAKNQDEVIYRLDRLGIPLIEIGTGPDITDPDEAKEVAQNIGMILRSTGKVARGIGTIRQDINVSIKEGQRIEIKGAQDLKMIPTLIEYEVLRQINLIKLKKELGKIEIEDKIENITSIFEKSESKIIKTALEKKGVIKAIKVPGFKGILGRELQPGRRVGTEISDYAKSKSGVGGLFHTDELPKYGITQEDVDQIKNKLHCKENDAFILIADTESKVDRALKAAIERIKMFEKGVIKEVRRANPDGTTTFMRPIPGAARMYPETDIKPIRPKIDEIELPELISEKIERLQKEYKISKDYATLIAKEYPEVEDEFKVYKHIEPTFLATTSLNLQKEIKKTEDIEISDDEFENYKLKLYPLIEKGEIPKNLFKTIIVDAHKNNKKLDVSKFKQLPEEEVRKKIKEIIHKNTIAPFNALMGLCMKEFNGKADGKLISKILNEEINIK